MFCTTGEWQKILKIAHFVGGEEMHVKRQIQFGSDEVKKAPKPLQDWFYRAISKDLERIALQAASYHRERGERIPDWLKKAELAAWQKQRGSKK